MPVRLTDRVVRSLPAPAKGNRLTYDTEVKGFAVRTTSAGAKSFVQRYRADGRQRCFTIGSFPDWSTTASRDEASALKRRVDVGEDPMGDRHADRSSPTVEALAKRYLLEHASRKRPGGAREDASLLRQRILPELGKLKVAAVRRSDIETFLRGVSQTAPVRANRAQALLSKAFDLAIGWELRTDNPCKGIKRNPEHKRERYLTHAELERLMAALAAHPYQASANVVRLLLLTGARKGEVLGATWDQFDLEAGVWVKPAAVTKQNKLHRVPLSAPARLLLADMRAKSDSAVLFRGRRGNDAQAGLKRFWATICHKADIRGVRLHDLRHSYASYLASAGLSLPVIGALLGHTQAATTQRYAHLLDDPLRAATERVGAIVTTAGQAAAKVAPLIPGRRA